MKKHQEGKMMSIRAQADQIGFQIIGELTRCMGKEPSHLYQYYYDPLQGDHFSRTFIITHGPC